MSITLNKIKGSLERVLDKNLQDLVRGIRNHKDCEVCLWAWSTQRLFILFSSVVILQYGVWTMYWHRCLLFWRGGEFRRSAISAPQLVSMHHSWYQWHYAVYTVSTVARTVWNYPNDMINHLHSINTFNVTFFGTINAEMNYETPAA